MELKSVQSSIMHSRKVLLITRLSNHCTNHYTRYCSFADEELTIEKFVSVEENDRESQWITNYNY